MQDSDVKALKAAKANVRAGVLAGRAALGEGDRAAAGRALRDTLLARPEVEMAASVAAYVSVGTEPDTRGLIFALWKRGTYVLLPLLQPDGDLNWASYEGPDSLAAGPRGLLEPTEPRRGPNAIRAADVVIVPALAVDRAGTRLGRGGGSYDRALSRVSPNVLTVAMLYDGELMEELPQAPHDRKVKSAVTPSAGLLPLPATPHTRRS